MESDARSGWVLGLSLVAVLLLLVFAAMMVYVTDTVEGRAPEGQAPQAVVEPPPPVDQGLQARLDEALEKNSGLEKQLNEMTTMMEELKVLVGAKGITKDSFQVAIGNLKRGYAVCQQGGNTLIEATVEHGDETVAVIGDIPPDMRVSLKKGDQTSDLEEIVSFLQDVYQYEKDQNCRFNYRLKYATDSDYKRAREGYDKYLYREK
jgi:hypothetical protein